MSSDFLNDLFEEAKPSERRVYGVHEITREIKFALEEGFPPLWVEGEISNFKRHSSGHLYFTLKDSDAQLNCVMWRGKNLKLHFEPRDGQKIQVYGSLTVYERQGKYQLDADMLIPAGQGTLQMAYEALKKQLFEEGLFDEKFKKPLPEFPTAIGVITSPEGAAFRDIISVIQRRYPITELFLFPVRVQGETAAAEIAHAIALANEYGVDVCIAGRGGGSIEDLWAFNEEMTARAIFDSKIPIISAVGHEIDFTISDFVADARAATPSAAAEMAAPDIQSLYGYLYEIKNRITSVVNSSIDLRRRRLVNMENNYVFRRPEERIRELRFRLDDSSRLLNMAVCRKVEEKRALRSKYEHILTSLGPVSVLKRGYSLTVDKRTGSVIRKISQAKAGQSVEIQFFDGRADGSILNVYSKRDGL